MTARTEPYQRPERERPHPESGLRPGRRWCHLEVLEKIGAGGYGEVYRAYDPSLQIEVALKLWITTDRLRGGAERVLWEARRLARVRHPNVLVVHGADVDDGRPGMWTDLVQGRNLEEVLEANGPLGAQEAAVIGLDLCRALAAVHAAGWCTET